MIEETSVNATETITIPVGEYKKLLETHTRVEVFKNFVNADERVHVVMKKECGAILNFAVEVKEDDESD